MSTDTISHPLGTPTGDTTSQTTTDKVIRPLTFDDILNTARLPEKRAKICLRADLEAERDEIMAELATLVGIDGRLLEQPTDSDASLEDSNEARARALNTRLESITSEMRDSMRYVRMRGMSSDDLAAFNKQWEPKDRKADATEYNHRLVAACAVEPVLTLEQVRDLGKSLGSNAMLNLVQTAMTVCYGGGVDVPKLPTISLPPLEQ